VQAVAKTQNFIQTEMTGDPYEITDRNGEQRTQSAAQERDCREVNDGHRPAKGAESQNPPNSFFGHHS
jgi:hypothetical protein